jgi:hypothetical protein
VDVPAVIAGDVATPFASVITTAVVEPFGKCPKLLGTEKLTWVLTSGLPYWSVAKATMGWAKFVRVVAVWPLPDSGNILVGTDWPVAGGTSAFDAFPSVGLAPAVEFGVTVRK